MYKMAIAAILVLTALIATADAQGTAQVTSGSSNGPVSDADPLPAPQPSGMSPEGPSPVHPSPLPPPTANQRTPREIAPGILNPNDVWNDPTAQYRPLELDPWRIAAEFGGGIMHFDDMKYRTNTPPPFNEVDSSDETAGFIRLRLDLSARVSRTPDYEWYFVTNFWYEGRSEDNPFKIRGDTLVNRNVNPVLGPLVQTKILNRNQTSALAGVRVISRGGQLAYSGTFLTGMGARQWYEEDLLWVNYLELDISYRITQTLVGPFVRIIGIAGINTEEIARVEGRTELGIRYVSDVVRGWVTLFDGFGFIEGGEFNDENSRVEARENRVILGLGTRIRVWNFEVEGRFGYIASYLFEEKFQGFDREAEGSGGYLLYFGLRATF